MTLITETQRRQLLENGRRSQHDPGFDPRPVVKLFTPDAGATWLLSELDPGEPDIAFGLCDLGLGFPELGRVRLSEIASVRGQLGLPVERDLYFSPTQSLSRYADQARREQCIRAGECVALAPARASPGRALHQPRSQEWRKITLFAGGVIRVSTPLLFAYQHHTFDALRPLATISRLPSAPCAAASNRRASHVWRESVD